MTVLNYSSIVHSDFFVLISNLHRIAPAEKSIIASKYNSLIGDLSWPTYNIIVFLEEIPE